MALNWSCSCCTTPTNNQHPATASSDESQAPIAVLTAGWVSLALQHGHIEPCSAAGAAAAAAAACTRLLLTWQLCTDALAWGYCSQLRLAQGPAGQWQGTVDSGAVFLVHIERERGM